MFSKRTRITRIKPKKETETTTTCCRFYSIIRWRCTLSNERSIPFESLHFSQTAHQLFVMNLEYGEFSVRCELRKCVHMIRREKCFRLMASSINEQAVTVRVQKLPHLPRFRYPKKKESETDRDEQGSRMNTLKSYFAPNAYTSNFGSQDFAKSFHLACWYKEITMSEHVTLTLLKEKMHCPWNVCAHWNN